MAHLIGSPLSADQGLVPGMGYLFVSHDLNVVRLLHRNKTSGTIETNGC